MVIMGSGVRSLGVGRREGGKREGEGGWGGEDMDPLKKRGTFFSAMAGTASTYYSL